MSDHILVSGLRVETRVGWTDEERARPQTVLIDLDMETDVAASAASDDLADTIDYGTVIAEVADYVGGRETKLLERLAGEVAEMVAARNGVKRVTVEIAKEVVPVPQDVARVAVRTARSG
ncbi:MAG TPA: dihydroneopterin aldolase [Actinomycetota bacterium]|nr:dihydroneopterin aldolase [Actinomycetota bacterium]